MCNHGNTSTPQGLAETSGKGLEELGTSQNSTPQTTSPNTQALMAIDIPALKESLMDAKASIANGDAEDALTTVTDVENQLLTLQPQPPIIGEFQIIKDWIDNADLKKALADISRVEKEVLKAETEIFTAQLENPELLISQQDEDD